MKLIFAPTNNHHDYTINGETINGIDLSDVLEGEKWDLPELRAVGIREVSRQDGELLAVLQQKHGKMPGISQDWESGEPIDAEDYDPDQCYIRAAPLFGVAGWHWERGEDMAWNAVLDLEPEEEAEQ